MRNSWPVIIVCLLLIAGCDREEKRRKEIIERGVELSIEQYRIRQEALCKRKAIEKAVVIADSIMRSEGPKRPWKLGEKPPPATKPFKPPVKQLPDSLGHDALRKD